jgi:branched-chain amino acid transport system permease protein
MLLISSILFHSPWGLRLDGSRENEIVSYILGISPVTNRYLAHTAGAIVSSLAGSLYAHHIGFISPSPFSFVLSVYVLTAVVLGGIGSPQGAIFASIFIGFTQPVLQLIGISSFYATVIRQLIFGLVLIGIILWLPEGFYKKNSGYRRIGELSNGKY